VVYVKNDAITPLQGQALCSGCDQVWYSAAFLHPEGAAEDACAQCGGSLEPVTNEPFGDGTLFVPAEWAVANPQR
jgi:hypothetical protein